MIRGLRTLIEIVFWTAVDLSKLAVVLFFIYAIFWQMQQGLPQ